MNEPYLSTKSLIYAEGGFLRLVRGIVDSNYDITSIAGVVGVDCNVSPWAKSDCLSVVSMAPGYASGAPAADKFYDTKLSTGVTLRVANNANAVLAKSGYKTSVDNKAVEKFDATVLIDHTLYIALLEDYRKGYLVIGIRGMGLKVEDNSMVGYEHILGTITEFSATPKDGLMEAKLVITAQACTINSSATATCTYTAYNTLATGGSANVIEPVGMEVSGGYTITAVSSQEFTNLITTGKIVQTTAS